MCAGARASVGEELIAVDQNVGQVIVQAELKQGITGACNRPAVLIMVIHQEPMGHGAVPESSVMICPSPTAILDAVDKTMVVHHLMQQGGADVFNGSGQSSCAQIYFMGRTVLTDPGVIAEGEVAEGPWGRLDRDSGS